MSDLKNLLLRRKIYAELLRGKVFSWRFGKVLGVIEVTIGAGNDIAEAANEEEASLHKFMAKGRAQCGILHVDDADAYNICPVMAEQHCQVYALKYILASASHGYWINHLGPEWRGRLLDFLFPV